jgi:hypothetical protein
MFVAWVVVRSTLFLLSIAWQTIAGFDSIQRRP